MTEPDDRTATELRAAIKVGRASLVAATVELGQKVQSLTTVRGWLNRPLRLAAGAYALGFVLLRRKPR
jgi:hypothetical protein